MKREYILCKLSSGMHFIQIEDEVAESFLNASQKRALCRLNEQIEFHCAFMRKKEGGYFINIGSAICKKLQIREGSKVSASFMADHSDYQFAMPEEFLEVLHTDEKAFEAFSKITKGNQRSLIYLVMQVKSTEKRIERALKMAERLKLGITSAKEILKK